jgi:hypothetical protein
VPVHVVIDRRARWSPKEIGNFWKSMWPEAVHDLARCGVQIDSEVRAGEVKRTPGGSPDFIGVEPGVINLVITDMIPMRWDGGRGLAGVTTRYEGYHLCVIALSHAHGNQIPLLSVNTCLHELLHALMLDIYESRPSGAAGEQREFRIDSAATGLWLFGQGNAVRESARRYVERLRSGAASR